MLLFGRAGGTYTSPILPSPVAATEAVLSVNLSPESTSEGGLVGLVAHAADERNWSGWYRMCAWGRNAPQPDGEDPTGGRVNVDLLAVKRPSRLWRYRIAWTRAGGALAIRRVALAVREAAAEPSFDEPNRQAWGRLLSVPFQSQWSSCSLPADRVCSPAAVTMVLRYLGVQATLEEFGDAAYDPLHRIYGNWSLNMLAASQRGVKAYVDFGRSMRYFEDRIAAGGPTIASIAWEEGALAGAAVPASQGHLVVVAGFSDTGDPLVRDPAARGVDCWTTFRRAEFERAWIGHGAAVYVVEREQT